MICQLMLRTCYTSASRSVDEQQADINMVGYTGRYTELDPSNWPSAYRPTGVQVTSVSK